MPKFLMGIDHFFVTSLKADNTNLPYQLIQKRVQKYLLLELR